MQRQQADLKLAAKWLNADLLKQWTGLRIESVHLNSIGKIIGSVAIVGSQRIRHPEWSQAWRSAIEAALLNAKKQHKIVLYSSENTLGQWIAQFAASLQVQCASIRFADEPDAATDNHIKLSSIDPDIEITRLQSVAPELQSLPLVDRGVFALSDEIWTLEVARASKTQALIELWKSANHRNTQNIELEIPSISSNDNVLNKQKFATVERQVHAAVIPQRMMSKALWKTAVISIGDVAASEYLIHCTRGRDGKFANQSSIAYSAEILLQPADVDATPLETLRQILSQRRIVATSYLQRSDMASVSFSAVPLLELLKRRKYQSHLRRWDWEPYGLAIKRQCMVEKFAAAEVLYQEASEFEKLSQDRRWLFQSTSTSSKRDWSAEREWRCVGDVRLIKLKPTDGFVFVPSEEAAVALAKISPLPIVVLEMDLQ